MTESNTPKFPTANALGGFTTSTTPETAETEQMQEDAQHSGAEADTNKIYDVIVVGSGPAGYTAALYTARANLSPLVFEGYEFGGELMNTTEVENFPGFQNGIQGPDLMMEMRAQAERFGADLRADMVDSVELEGDIKKVVVGDEEFHARAVILATGAAPRHLGIPGEQELTGRGVSTCATCDGFFFKDHHIAVVGGGDSAMEEATFLTRFGSKVTIIHRREEFRASQIMLDRAKENEKISFLTNAVVEEVLEDGGSVSGLRVKDTQTCLLYTSDAADDCCRV